VRGRRRGGIWAAAWTGGIAVGVGLAGVRCCRDQRQGSAGVCGVGNGVRTVKSKPNRRYRLSAKTG
jgi:hypothetical protein